MGFDSMINRIPNEVSGQGAVSNPLYMLKDVIYDYAIAGLPFAAATRDQFPYTEQMAAIRKQQFDSSTEPGEQSLYGWWLRSQANFTGGAGVLYQDPDADNQFGIRFADSLGVDPWTAGQVSLLRTTTQVTSSVGAGLLKVRGFVDTGGVNAFYEARSTSVWIYNGSAANTSYDTAQNVYDIDTTGSKVIIGDAGGIYVYDHANLGTNHRAYTAANTQWTLGFKKNRLIATSGPKVWSLDINASSVALSGVTPIFTMQNANWSWKSITDGPTAIYIAGDAGTASEIHKFQAVADASGVPQVSWTGVTCVMPTGEIINEIYQYVESFVGIATNKGFRVGQIDSNGDISYGPLLFQPAGGCKGIIGFDRFMWVGSTNAHDGASGIYRVDLGTVIQEQTTNAVRYAFVRDIYIPGFTGTVTSLTMFGNSDQKVIAGNNSGSYLEHATNRLQSGYLKTGRVRYNTEEPKLYKFMSVRIPAVMSGSVSIDLLPDTGGDIPYVTYTAANAVGNKDIAISIPPGPHIWMALKFTLNRDAVDLTQGGILNGWQLKALPGSIRQRLVSVVLCCFDEEQDKKGQRYGYDGYARDRLNAFKAAMRTGDTFIFQDLAANTSDEMFIEDWQFRQTNPPGDGPNKGSQAGFLQVTMRTVAESS